MIIEILEIEYLIVIYKLIIVFILATIIGWDREKRAKVLGSELFH